MNDRIYRAIIAERKQQDRRFGAQNHADLPNTIGQSRAEMFAHLGIADPETIRAEYEIDKKVGQVNWSRILIEEVSEAVESAALEDSVGLRTELEQCAAVIVAWLEAMDRRECAANSDFEGLARREVGQ